MGGLKVQLYFVIVLSFFCFWGCKIIYLGKHRVLKSEKTCKDRSKLFEILDILKMSIFSVPLFYFQKALKKGGCEHNAAKTEKTKTHPLHKIRCVTFGHLFLCP